MQTKLELLKDYGSEKTIETIIAEMQDDCRLMLGVS